MNPTKVAVQKYLKYEAIRQVLSTMDVEIFVFVLDMSDFNNSYNGFPMSMPSYTLFEDLYNLNDLIKSQTNYSALRTTLKEYDDQDDLYLFMDLFESVNKQFYSNNLQDLRSISAGSEFSLNCGFIKEEVDSFLTTIQDDEYIVEARAYIVEADPVKIEQNLVNVLLQMIKSGDRPAELVQIWEYTPLKYSRLVNDIMHNNNFNGPRKKLVKYPPLSLNMGVGLDLESVGWTTRFDEKEVQSGTVGLRVNLDFDDPSEVVIADLSRDCLHKYMKYWKLLLSPSSSQFQEMMKDKYSHNDFKDLRQEASKHFIFEWSFMIQMVCEAMCMEMAYIHKRKNYMAKLMTIGNTELMVVMLPGNKLSRGQQLEVLPGLQDHVLRQRRLPLLQDPVRQELSDQGAQHDRIAKGVPLPAPTELAVAVSTNSPHVEPLYEAWKEGRLDYGALVQQFGVELAGFIVEAAGISSEAS